MKEKKQLWIMIGMVSGVAMFISLMLVPLYEYQRFWQEHEIPQYEEAKIREFKVNDGFLTALFAKEEEGLDIIKELTVQMIVHDYDLSQVTEVEVLSAKGYVARVYRLSLYEQLYTMYEKILSNIKYFPIPEDLNNKQTISFDNSWMGTRTYGGIRGHEGVDLMPSLPVRGYFPVLSVSDGVIEKKGWLDKGGYRIGVRSESGTYFYYAHLESYADGLAVGDKVKAGQLLGFMGDTGYSPIEGTTGQFEVHLHFGIYLSVNKKEMSINPYWVLKYLESRRLQYSF